VGTKPYNIENAVKFLLDAPIDVQLSVKSRLYRVGQKTGPPYFLKTT